MSGGFFQRLPCVTEGPEEPMNETQEPPNPTIAVSVFTDRSECSAHIPFAPQLTDTHMQHSNTETQMHTQKEAANRKAIILWLNV